MNLQILLMIFSEECHCENFFNIIYNLQGGLNRLANLSLIYPPY